MRIAVIGNDDCVLGFSLVGVTGTAARGAEDLREALDRYAADETIALVLVTEDVAAWDRARVDELKVGLRPLVVEIPGLVGGEGAPSLREFVQRAVGISLGGA